METKDILLIFDTYNVLKYWLNYILRYLRNNDIIFNCTYYSNEIIVKNRVIKFMVCNKKRIEEYMIGRRNIITYDTAEGRLEANFEDFMKEILNA